MYVDDVEFVNDEDLPAGRLRRDQLNEFGAVLRTRPGVWAKYPGSKASPGTVAWRINHGASPSLPTQDFEAKVFKGEIYVRFKEQHGRS